MDTIQKRRHLKKKRNDKRQIERRQIEGISGAGNSFVIMVDLRNAPDAGKNLPGQDTSARNSREPLHHTIQNQTYNCSGQCWGGLSHLVSSFGLVSLV
jgi:hypothetical protein